MIWRPAGAARREFNDRHGVSTGAAMSSAPASTSASVADDDVGDLEGDPQAWGDLAAHLDLVDHPLLRRVRDLERGATGVEDGDAGVARAAEGVLFAQAEDVAEEADGLVVVIGLDHEAHLEHAWRIGLHRSTIVSRRGTRA